MRQQRHVQFTASVPSQGEGTLGQGPVGCEISADFRSAADCSRTIRQDWSQAAAAEAKSPVNADPDAMGVSGRWLEQLQPPSILSDSELAKERRSSAMAHRSRAGRGAARCGAFVASKLFECPVMSWAVVLRVRKDEPWLTHASVLLKAFR
jgi:hypothetical protein